MNALAEQIQDQNEDPDSIPLPSPEAPYTPDITNISDYIKERTIPIMALTRFIPPNTSNFKKRILDFELTIENGTATIKNDGPTIIISTPDGEKPIKINETLSFNINPNDDILWRKA